MFIGRKYFYHSYTREFPVLRQSIHNRIWYTSGINANATCRCYSLPGTWRSISELWALVTLESEWNYLPVYRERSKKRRQSPGSMRRFVVKASRVCDRFLATICWVCKYFIFKCTVCSHELINCKATWLSFFIRRQVKKLCINLVHNWSPNPPMAPAVW